MSGPQPKSKKALCHALRHGPGPLPPEQRDKDFGQLVEAGWLSHDNGIYELGPSCGLTLAIVARRESLECGVIRPDGRMIPRDDDPSVRFEAKKALFMPRNPRAKGRYTGITPNGFVTKLAALTKECLEHRRSVSGIGFSAVCIAWPGRIDRFARPDGGGRPLGNVHSYEQKASGGWTDGDVPVSLAELVEKGLEMAGFKKRPPILIVNDADAEMLAMANIPLEERSPTAEEAEEGPAARAQKIHERISEARVALGITVAGGIGGSLLIDGRLVRGQRGFVGELSEVPIDIKHRNLEKGRVTKLKSLSLATLKKKQGFPRWECPHDYTLDYWASSRSILDQLVLSEPESKYKQKKTYTEELGITREHSDPELSSAILRRGGRMIGLGIIGAVLMLDPAVILVSSPLPTKPLAEGVKELLNDEIGDVNPDEDIVFAVDGDPTRQMKGAARWAIQEIVNPALDEVCRARNDGLKELDVLELTPWP